MERLQGSPAVMEQDPATHFPVGKTKAQPARRCDSPNDVTTWLTQGCHDVTSPEVM